MALSWMLLKASSRSRKATRVYSFISSVFLNSATTEFSAVSEDYPLEYACCETSYCLTSVGIPCYGGIIGILFLVLAGATAIWFSYDS